MSQKLVDALRAAADRIEEEPRRYSWGETARCNCGHLVQQACGVSVTDLKKQIKEWEAGKLLEEDPDGTTTWTYLAEYEYCTVSGLSIDQLFAQLKELGLKTMDFYELEYLKNSEVRKRAKLPGDYSYRNDSKSVVQYMRAWADILEEKMALEAAKDIHRFKVPSLSDLPKKNRKHLPKKSAKMVKYANQTR